jgi:hypothetical protein
MGNFVTDEKAVALMIETIELSKEEKDQEETELERQLLRRKMSRLAKHKRSDLSEAEKELLTMDGEAYQNIIHSK